MIPSRSDAACLSALTAALGHAPPFTNGELGSIETLTITHARDLTPIEECVGLRHLRIVAAELENLISLEKMVRLERLEVYCSDLRSLLGAAFCERLEHIDLLFTAVQDAGDLLGVAAWDRGVLVGNPWNEVSWSVLSREAERGAILADLPQHSEWEETRRLWQKANACCGRIAGGYVMMARLGLPQLTSNRFDALHVAQEVVRDELDDPAFRLEGMFQKYAKEIVEPDLGELAASRPLGRSADARKWIAASALSGDDKAALDRFVTRFATMIFYRRSEAALNRSMAHEKFSLPLWYRELRLTLDGWTPQRIVPAPVRFRRFEGWSPRAERLDGLTYLLGLRSHGPDTEAQLLSAGFVIVGLSLEQPQSTLAIQLHGEDRQIYEYSEEDVLDAMAEKRNVESAMQPVFSSYAAMLDAVLSVAGVSAAEVKSDG